MTIEKLEEIIMYWRAFNEYQGIQADNLCVFLNYDTFKYLRKDSWLSDWTTQSSPDPNKFHFCGIWVSWSPLVVKPTDAIRGYLELTF